MELILMSTNSSSNTGPSLLNENDENKNYKGNEEKGEIRLVTI